MTIEEPKARIRRQRPAAPTTPDPIEIAMEAEAADGSADSPARRVLLKHEQLLGWQIMKERAGFGLRVLTGVAGVLVAAALIGLVWDATRYQGLVVQALAVPPDLAARGLTGDVMAGDLLDRLVAMQEQTDSVRAPSSYAIDWGDSTEVEIPQTGVSIGELQRSLRSWLGKETRITGVVYRMRDGQLAVTARTAGTAGVTFTGPEDELNSLMQKAAESVYARTQPYRFTVYLDADRVDEALPLYQAAERYGEPESLWLLRGWGINKILEGDARGALALYRQVEARAPDMGPLFQTIADAEGFLGHDEAEYQARVKAGRLIERSREVDPFRRADYARRHQIEAAFNINDLGRVQALIDSADPNPSERTYPGNRISLYSETHRLGLAGALLDEAEPQAAADLLAPLHLNRARLALKLGDPGETLRRIELARPMALEFLGDDAAKVYLEPYRVSALIDLGRTAEARGLAASLPRDCYFCVLARAEAAEAAGRRAEVDLWYAEADRQAPSLSEAPHLWGEALLRRGDTAGAVLKLAEAHRRSPRWADPLKAWGDVMAAGRDYRGATRKYRDAAERAPHWGALHLAWGRALEAQGKRAEAAVKYRAAAGMDLSAADRAEASRRVARAGR